MGSGPRCAPSFAPVDPPPRPCPPVEARPRKLSVTRIENWIANPYEIFARYVLKLEALKPLGELPDNAMRGQIVHHALHEFTVRHPDSLPDDIAAVLIESADRHFTALGWLAAGRGVLAPRLRALCQMVRGNRAGAPQTASSRVAAEVAGELYLAVERGFDLSVRARPHRSLRGRQRRPL
jgi:ATP-dependent helicase/nuclease subunit B